MVLVGPTGELNWNMLTLYFLVFCPFCRVFLGMGQQDKRSQWQGQRDER